MTAPSFFYEVCSANMNTMRAPKRAEIVAKMSMEFTPAKSISAPPRKEPITQPRV